MAGTLLELTAASAKLGADPLLVQGAGGNTSEKIGPIMWVKASGKWLAKASPENFFVPINYSALSEHLADPVEPDLKLFVAEPSELRPSIETALHVALPHRVVLHVHPVAVIAIAIQKNAAQKFAPLFETMKWAWIPYIKPGWELAQSVWRAYNQDKSRHVFVLGNHGLVVAADTYEQALSQIDAVVGLCETEVRQIPMADEESALRNCPNDMVLCADPATHALALDPICFDFAKQGVLYPDQAVFMGKKVAFSGDEGASYCVVPSCGVYVRKDVGPGVVEMLACHAEVLRRLPAGTALNPLSADQVEDLLNWDAEKYRQGKKV